MSQMGRHFMATSDDRADEAERELSRLRDIISRAAGAMADTEHETYLEWLSGRCERMGWELSPPRLRAAGAAIVEARNALAEAKT